MSEIAEPPVSKTEQADALLAITDKVLEVSRCFSDSRKTYTLSNTIPPSIKPRIGLSAHQSIDVIEVAKRLHERDGATPAHVANIIFESMSIKPPTELLQGKYQSEITLYAIFRTGTEGWIERRHTQNHIGSLLLQETSPLGDCDLNPVDTVLEHYRAMERLPEEYEDMEYLNYIFAEPIGFEDFNALRRVTLGLMPGGA